MNSVTLELDENPEAADLRLVLDGVRQFNQKVTGHQRPRSVACFLREEDGRIVGGVQGNLWGRSVHIDALWVDELYRTEGHGSKLMKALEHYAAAHGYSLAFLETASFQALPFYQGLGYRIFGELPGISEGETLFFLQKELSALLE